MAVSTKDVADALGKLVFTLTGVTKLPGWRLFLSRLVYLDAIGVVGLNHIDIEGLELLSSSFMRIVDAVEKQQDVYVQVWSE